MSQSFVQPKKALAQFKEAELSLVIFGKLISVQYSLNHEQKFINRSTELVS